MLVGRSWIFALCGCDSLSCYRPCLVYRRVIGGGYKYISHDLTLTSCFRKIFDDERLAETLRNRLEPFYGGIQIVDEDGCRWAASRLNMRFRFAKYERGSVKFLSTASLLCEFF